MALPLKQSPQQLSVPYTETLTVIQVSHYRTMYQLQEKTGDHNIQISMSDGQCQSTSHQ